MSCSQYRHTKRERAERTKSAATVLMALATSANCAAAPAWHPLHSPRWWLTRMPQQQQPRRRFRAITPIGMAIAGPALSAHRTSSPPPSGDSSLARNSTLDRIQSSAVIACLRSADEEVALHAARAALDGGVSVLEVTMTTSGVFQVVKELAREYPAATLGAGTVLTRQDAELAKEAGASFLTSPVSDKDLVQAHSKSDVLFIPGAMTPSEIQQAHRWGASCVKLYPVSLMGGVQYVEMLKKLFPSIPMIASNGIFLDTAKSYLQVGSTAVIMSDAVFNKTALAQHDYAQILQLSQMVQAALTL